MSALQDEIRQVIEAANAPLMREIHNLKRLVERLEKDAYPEFVTVREAAKILKCTQQTVHRHCNAGKLQARRDGRRKLISYASLVEIRP